MSDGDLRNALRHMFQRGLQMPQGGQMPGLPLLDRLRKRRREQLDRHDLGSALEDIKKKLDEVIQTERTGIGGGSQRERARKKLEPLDQLLRIRPAGSSGCRTARIRRSEAERLFRADESLQRQMMQPFMQGMKQSLRTWAPTAQADARDDA